MVLPKTKNKLNKKKLLLAGRMTERPEYKKRKRLEQISLLRHRSVCRVSSVSTPRQGSPGSGAPHGTAVDGGARRQDACQARARAQGRSGPPSGLTICLMAGAGGKGKFRSASSLGVVGPLHPPQGQERGEDIRELSEKGIGEGQQTYIVSLVGKAVTVLQQLSRLMIVSDRRYSTIPAA